MKTQADALVNGGQTTDKAAQLRLPDQDDGQVRFARAIEVREHLKLVERLRGHFLGLVEDENEVAIFGVNAFDGATEALVTGVLGLTGFLYIAVQLLNDGAEQIVERESGIFLRDDLEFAGFEAFGENGAGEGLAATDLAGEHAQQHGFLLDQEREAVERLIVVAALEKEARVPCRLKWALAQIPVLQQIHDFTLVSGGRDCTSILYG